VYARGGVLFGHATDAAAAPGLGGIIPRAAAQLQKALWRTSGARDRRLIQQLIDWMCGNVSTTLPSYFTS
jgi:hypothetical protein